LLEKEHLVFYLKEETSLPVDILKYVSLWNGSYSSHEIRSFVFVCRAKTDKVVLSDEHSDYCWIEIKKLYQWRDRTDFDLTMWPQWIFSSEIELL
ncbi:MAG TPA: hypothetical protein P5048_03430, partial [Chlamydiales bacterium]|nr:hypothetical protein [Chlamydiales bacterium]